MDLGIEGRSVLVTAASEGLGRAIAVALAGDGMKLTIVARREDVLEATAVSIREQTGAHYVADNATINNVFAAFLYSEQAAYITGQNLLIDGGQGRTNL